MSILCLNFVKFTKFCRLILHILVQKVYIMFDLLFIWTGRFVALTWPNVSMVHTYNVTSGVNWRVLSKIYPQPTHQISPTSDTSFHCPLVSFIYWDWTWSETQINFYKCNDAVYNPTLLFIHSGQNFKVSYVYLLLNWYSSEGFASWKEW